MLRKSVVTMVLAIAALTLFSCSQETPVAQNEFSNSSAEDAVALYMLGNEEPIEAELAGNFILHGPGPFFLWVLDLTDEQKTQLREIGEKFRSQMHELRMTRGDREEMKSKHEELRQVMMEEVLSILTEDQLAIVEEIQAQIDSGVYPDIIIEKRVEKLTELLNLDEDQQAALKELITDHGAKMIALRNEESDPRECHEQGRAIMQEFREAVEAMLSDEQLALFEEMKVEFKEKHPHRGPGPGRGRK